MKYTVAIQRVKHAAELERVQKELTQAHARIEMLDDQLYRLQELFGGAIQRLLAIAEGKEALVNSVKSL